MRRNDSGRETQQPPEIILDLEASIAALKTLCEAYDKGARNVAPSMTNEVIKILDSNKVTRRIAGQKKFVTIDLNESEGNFIAECKLILPKLTGAGHGASIDFVPGFEASWTSYADCSFGEWWKKDVIYRASSANDPFGGVSADPLHPLSKVERFTLTRSNLIRAVRNQRGAHIDDALARELKHLEQARSFGLQFSYLQNGVAIEPKIIGSPLKAMIRQISEEVLAAYDHAVGVWGRFGKGEGVVPHMSMTYHG